MFRVPTLIMLYGTFDKSFSKLPLCWIHTCRRNLVSLITNFNAVPIFLFCLFHLRNQGIIVLWITYVIQHLRVIMLLNAVKINIKTSINYPQLKKEHMYFHHFDNISLHKIYFWHFWLTDSHPVITHSNKENCYRTKYFSSIVSACDRWVYDLSSFYIRVLRKTGLV